MLCWKFADNAHVRSWRHVRWYVDGTPPAPPASPASPAPPARRPWCAAWCFEHERPFYYRNGTEQLSWDLAAAHLLEPAPDGGIPGDPSALLGSLGAWSGAGRTSGN